MPQSALEMINVVRAKNKRMKLPLFGMNRKEGLAPRRRPALRGQGVTLGSVWHLLSGESWLGAEGENHGS